MARCQIKLEQPTKIYYLFGPNCPDVKLKYHGNKLNKPAAVPYMFAYSSYVIGCAACNNGLGMGYTEPMALGLHYPGGCDVA